MNIDARMALAGILMAATGCSDPDHPAHPDAAVADATPTSDAGVCGATSFYTAELLDWDSSDGSFQGVFGAAWTNSANPTETGTTAPNGRIELCVTPPTADGSLDLVVALPDPYLDAHVFVRAADFVLPQNLLSARGLTVARITTLFDDYGQTYDPDAGQVLLYLPIDRVTQSISAASELVLSGNDDDGDGKFTWTQGDTGRYVFFGNVDLAGGAISIAQTTGAAFEVELQPGQLTIVNQPVVLE